MSAGLLREDRAALCSCREWLVGGMIGEIDSRRSSTHEPQKLASCIRQLVDQVPCRCVVLGDHRLLLDDVLSHVNAIKPGTGGLLTVVVFEPGLVAVHPLALV